jgi:hypothetical protein
MNIHWKALEDHVLMAPLVFRFIFGGKLHFLYFSLKNLVFKDLMNFSSNIFKSITWFLRKCVWTALSGRIWC